MLHTEANVSKNKVDSAEEGLMALNSNITYVKHNTALTAANAGIVLCSKLSKASRVLLKPVEKYCRAVQGQETVGVLEECHIECTSHVISPSISEGIVTQYDIVVDCSDNAATRYLVNDVCVFLNKPLVSGSALR